MTTVRHDLITGKVTVSTPEEDYGEDFMTSLHKAELGDCEYECYWDSIYGWVPEVGCPIHD